MEIFQYFTRIIFRRKRQNLRNKIHARIDLIQVFAWISDWKKQKVKKRMSFLQLNVVWPVSRNYTSFLFKESYLEPSQTFIVTLLYENCQQFLNFRKKSGSFMLDNILNTPLKAFKYFPLNSTAMFTWWFYAEATNH